MAKKLQFLLLTLMVTIGLIVIIPNCNDISRTGEPSTNPSVAVGLIDDFDDGDDDNLFDGANELWGMALTRSYDDANAMGGTGKALRINYNMGLDGWSAAVFGIGSSFKNVSSYNYLIFYIKGTVDNFGIAMKDSSNEKILAINDYIEGGAISDTYKKVTVPLSAFTGVTLTDITYVWINFASGDMSTTTGTIYIDDLGFAETEATSSSLAVSSSSSSSSSTASSSATLIDNFDDEDDNNFFNGTNGPWGMALTRSFDAGALQIDYNMALEGWSAFSFGIGSGYNDFTSYSNLTFYIKGTTDSYGVAMKDSANNEIILDINSYIEGGSVISGDYRKVTVPLSAFTSVNKSNVTFIWINFAAGDMSNTTGTIYVEDLALE